jgi:hypothetical protein
VTILAAFLCERRVLDRWVLVWKCCVDVERDEIDDPNDGIGGIFGAFVVSNDDLKERPSVGIRTFFRG